MVAGVTWVLERNDDPTSPLYRRIDVAHVGATGHSQGGLATTQAAGDSHITTMAPLCGASRQRNLNGPAFFFCGGEDTVVTCAGIQSTYEAVTSQPAMFANYLTADHADWVTFRGMNPSPVEVTVTAWMRVQLMNDTALRSWFYGPSCKLCTDPAWQVLQKNMDE
jgi:dienelactone hydrolase